ncbi:hypothetical protein HanRHA438_Chr17g0827741 [Helianthus annuus]|nr:hypothetical protein HanRHA438_Chr17g0827741 [Helianthus annuus]
MQMHVCHLANMHEAPSHLRSWVLHFDEVNREKKALKEISRRRSPPPPCCSPPASRCWMPPAAAVPFAVFRWFVTLARVR